jgi:uracil-DNA glycosylase
MHEARRLAYLNAMGVDVWRLRGAEAASWAADAPLLLAPAQPAPPLAKPAPSPAPSPSAPRAPAASSLAPPPAPAAAAPPPPARAAHPAPADDEPPPWSDADLAGFPADEIGAGLDFDPAPATAPLTANPVAAMDWPALEQAVAGCRACGLCARRTKTVFGVGDRAATVMFVGEGPGADEDRRGEPFVGRAGQLLNRMLAAAGLKREQVYIANVVKCRPPNNRNPSPDEAAACRAYLERQIELVAPRLIVCLGLVPAHNLLGTTDSHALLRGRLHAFGPRRTPLLVTYHPSYYLRSPEQKVHGWRDLQRMLEFLARDAAGGAG